MRFGGPILKPYAHPDEWLERVREMGYSAVYFPVDHTAPEDLIQTYVRLARSNNLALPEVGAWSNPLSRDPMIATAAFTTCCCQLDLAERIGAACCVNIAGSCSDIWDGPHADNYSEDTFALIVDTVRRIIDTVKPQHAAYSLELMPWMLPDSADTYLELIKAIDRSQFAVHLDPVNIICSPRAYYANGHIIQECFDKLGPWIRSCHAKDIRLENQLTTHLVEAIPGQGHLDYRTYLSCVNRLPGDVALMMEHLSDQEQVLQGAAYIRRVAGEISIRI
jgi:sugar phosphate isomerase/epimerase